jgi:2-polyprenyl-3-methyl-5-hydroxy-6-metoxy-1,4-benzoquinol methylase
MSEIAVEKNGRAPRLLVVIASFGEKNLEFLRRITRQYRRMTMHVDVVVVSEAPKPLDPDIKLVVGLPSRNPWSLPFAHKKILAENLDSYDLFAYSEDDIDVTEENIQAFLHVAPQLEHGEIAGYLRYEVSSSGLRSLPDVHAAAHWKPESVRRRGPHTIAEFTNEHAAFYLLTQAQLRQAIDSGGFLRAPCEGRYDMACTAATDPYTNCGFRKVVCISTLEDFLIHHLSNRYVGKVGVSLPAFKRQVQTLIQICNGVHPAGTLCEVESKMPDWAWSKSYYEEPSWEVLKIIPADAQTILSIGCGWGATEVQLKRRGASVTVLPLDSVVGAEAAQLGFEVIYGSMEECFSQLGERTFDCVLVTNLVHLQRDATRLLEQSSKFVAGLGTIVITGPNLHSIRLLKRALRNQNYWKIEDYSSSGIRRSSPKELATHFRKSGFSVRAIRWYDHAALPTFLRRTVSNLGAMSARGWIFQAGRLPANNDSIQSDVKVAGGGAD